MADKQTHHTERRNNCYSSVADSKFPLFHKGYPWVVDVSPRTATCNRLVNTKTRKDIKRTTALASSNSRGKTNEMDRRCESNQNQCGDKLNCDRCGKNIRERRYEQEMDTERPLTTDRIPGDHQRERPDKAPIVNMPHGDVDNGHHLYHHAE